MTLQSDKMDNLAESVEKRQQTINENVELLQNLLIGVENLGENLKNIHKEMDYWRNPEVQVADAELQVLMNEAPTVAVVNPVSRDPIGVSISPETQHQYPAQRPNIFPTAGVANIPTNDVTVEEVEVTALKKPYPRAHTLVSQNVPVCQGFNLGQDGQSRIPQFFTMGTSTSWGPSQLEL